MPRPRASKKYRYKVTILNSLKRGKKAITRQLHHFDGAFRSVTDIKVHLMEEFKDDVPSTIKFDVGYYEKRTSKCWLVTAEDLGQMYSGLKTDEISLWCDAEVHIHDDKTSDGHGRHKKRDGGTSSKLDEEDVDEHYKTLTDKHGDTYSVPQRRLWARTLHCGTHDSFETPPPLPMFGPPPKRPKKDRDSLAESITNAAVAITKAFSPPTSTAQQPEQSQQAPLNLNPPSVVMSPGKSVELRMKNFQQLRFLQQLFEDNILSETEFLEQKRNILDSLRKLNN